jgi:hypothetical protein
MAVLVWPVILRLVEPFGRTRNDEHGGLGLSSALTTVTHCESSALDDGELEA